MAALAELVAVLLGLHAALGLHWFPRSAYVFRAWFGSAARAIPASRTWGSDRMALLFGPPLPGTGAFHLVELFPLSLGREAVLAHVAQDPNPGGRTPRSGRLLAWPEAAGTRAESRRVLVGRTLLVAVGSEALARQIARLLVRLAALDPAQREREIDVSLSRALDEVAAHERVTAWRAQARKLRWPAIATFLLLFVALPVVGATLGLAYAWPWLLGALVLLQVWTGLSFARAHRALNPLERGERVSRTVSVSLSPVEALRTAEILGRDLLAGFHPFAAGAVLLGRTEFELFAERVLRDALHPIPPACPSDDPVAVAVERAARERLVRRLTEAARRLGLQEDLATCAPTGDADELTYCPRCLRTYLLTTGACSECWDVPLAPLPGGSAGRRAASPAIRR